MMPKPLALTGAVLGTLSLGAFLYVAGLPGANLAARAGVPLIEAALDRMVVHEEPKPRIEAGFQNEHGETLDLGYFRGKVVLLNLWATWCPPCRKEMPAIDRLAAEVAGPDIAVVAISADRGGASVVREFYDETGVQNLEIFVDPSNGLPREAAAVGLPVTLILDREGREIARLTGEAEWDAPEVVDMLRGLAKQTGGGGDTPAGSPRFKRPPVKT